MYFNGEERFWGQVNLIKSAIYPIILKEISIDLRNNSNPE